MAYYCVPDDVREALAPGGEATWTASKTAASLSDDELQTSIREAQGVVDGYVSVRYVTPIPNGGAIDLLWGVTRSVSAYLATLTYRRNMDLTDDDPVARRYAQALATLRDIAAGKMVLDVDVPGDGTTPVPPPMVDVIVANPYTGDLLTRPLVPDSNSYDAIAAWGDHRG